MSLGREVDPIKEGAPARILQVRVSARTFAAWMEDSCRPQEEAERCSYISFAKCQLQKGCAGKAFRPDSAKKSDVWMARPAWKIASLSQRFLGRKN